MLSKSDGANTCQFKQGQTGHRLASPPLSLFFGPMSLSPPPGRLCQIGLVPESNQSIIGHKVTGSQLYRVGRWKTNPSKYIGYVTVLLTQFFNFNMTHDTAQQFTGSHSSVIQPFYSEGITQRCESRSGPDLSLLVDKSPKQEEKTFLTNEMTHSLQQPFDLQPETRERLCGSHQSSSPAFTPTQTNRTKRVNAPGSGPTGQIMALNAEYFSVTTRKGSTCD